ncbi:unnamed protein product [Caenorhabditis bovis]|uniref:Uncharacterized protein n=1 Tax=Caenorhabditis bovis TaxID=2654633 RepID=A0A8S1E7P0_9PELO|nr:unnamed protein product [Caenorhabditis bovis]
MFRLSHILFVLLVICLVAYSIPTTYSKNKVLNNIFKQIHNKNAAGDVFPVERYFNDAPYGLNDEQNYFVIV